MNGLCWRHNLALVLTLIAGLGACKPPNFSGGSPSKGAGKKPDSGSGAGTGSTPIDADHPDGTGTSDDPLTIAVGTSKSAASVLAPNTSILGCVPANQTIVSCDPTTGEIKGLTPGTTMVKVLTPDGSQSLVVKVVPNSTNPNDPLGTGSSSGSGSLASTTGIAAKPDAAGLLIEDGGVPCIDQLKPLHVMFVLDVTWSMDDSISAAVDNIQKFAQAVKGIIPEGAAGPLPDIKIGAVTYVDDSDDQQLVGLTDPAAFAEQMRDTHTRGGIHDHCEGGIAAARRAMEVLAAAQDTEKNGAIPMILVISDNYSHDSLNPPGSRTFDMAAVSVATPVRAFNNMMFFDAVPQSNDVKLFTACPGVPLQTTPAAQWEAARAAWKAAHPTATVAPGRSLGFPFTANTLLSTLPQELKQRLRICHK